jgi:hypothetical protein
LAASRALGEPPCECGPFDKPDRVVRQGTIALTETRTVSGAEIYLSNTTLRVAGAGNAFVVAEQQGAVPGGRLRVQARREIVFGPGFHAKRGSRLEASITPLIAAEAESIWPDDTAALHAASPASHEGLRPPDPYRIAPMRSRKNKEVRGTR